MAITPEMRQQYELYLPVAEFLRDLNSVARAALPSACWVPLVLRSPSQLPACTGYPKPRSVADLWAMLPARFQGRVAFAPEEILPLLCALADLRRYGTAPGRYEQQLDVLARWAGASGATSLRLLDVGCGVGHGTREAAGVLSRHVPGPVTALGITIEPLEAWLATNGETGIGAVPDAAGQEPGSDNVAFVCGDLRRIPAQGPFDVVLCNGVLGGDFFRAGRAIDAALDELTARVAEDGVLGLASRFHGGVTGRLERLKAALRQRGWYVQGQPRCLLGSRQPLRGAV